MADCVSLIAGSITPNCADPITKGYEHKGIIINWGDIDFTATTFADANTILNLVLKSGKRHTRLCSEATRLLPAQPRKWP